MTDTQLDAEQCLRRIQQFMRAEIDRQEDGEKPLQWIRGMEFIADLVDELVSDILRGDDNETTATRPDRTQHRCTD